MTDEPMAMTHLQSSSVFSNQSPRSRRDHHPISVTKSLRRAAPLLVFCLIPLFLARIPSPASAFAVAPLPPPSFSRSLLPKRRSVSMTSLPTDGSADPPFGATVIVAAAAGSSGIGCGGALPWRLRADMAYFKRVTTGDAPPPASGKRRLNAVIMGRKTWESIPPKFRPLDGRINVVLSRRGGTSLETEGDAPVIRARSLSEALFRLGALGGGSGGLSVGEIFVIGGGSVYAEALETPGLVSRVLLTEVSGEGMPDFDTFFPTLGDEWESEGREVEDGGSDAKSGLAYKFLEILPRGPDGGGTSADADEKKRKAPASDPNPEESQYLSLCRSIISDGVRRGDRTGTGTLSTFGVQMRFSLRDDALPLLTTKRTFWRGVAEELLWFLRGCTDANELAAKNIHIWDGNGSKEFLEKMGLGHREAGDLGPVYGFQWRHFGAEYTDMHADYRGKGVDQLAECIRKIKENPEDRRIIMSAWNPADLDKMALPPCHMFCQFYVDTAAGELSCQMYQRSADMGLGVPFNIASYALLTHMVAKVCGLKPGDFVHCIGDAHVYLNHVEALEEQIQRVPRAFPKIVFKREVEHIDEFRFEDFEVVGYDPHKAIKMKMAV